MTAKRSNKKLLERGDVLQTNPKEGFWGCAVVLTEQEAIGKAHPRCHIGTTPVIFRHKYTFDELDLDSLVIMEEESSIRTGPYEYKTLGASLDIGIYSRKTSQHTSVIGNIDINALDLPSLEDFKIGDGRNSGFPLRGPVTKNLGISAVYAWRAVHDAEQQEKETIVAMRSTEELLSKERTTNRK